jgi:hypothetical protein
MTNVNPLTASLEVAFSFVPATLAPFCSWCWRRIGNPTLITLGNVYGIAGGVLAWLAQRIRAWDLPRLLAEAFWLLLTFTPIGIDLAYAGAIWLTGMGLVGLYRGACLLSDLLAVIVGVPVATAVAIAVRQDPAQIAEEKPAPKAKTSRKPAARRKVAA